MKVFVALVLCLPISSSTDETMADKHSSCGNNIEEAMECGHNEAVSTTKDDDSVFQSVKSLDKSKYMHIE